MEKYKNKYRIPSARLQGYDYGQNGAYFITICTQNRVHFFGEIVGPPNVETRLIASLQPTEMGKLAEKYWFEIPDHFPFVELGAFAVMPNHIHGVLIVDKNDAETRSIASLPDKKTGGITGDFNPMLHENISRMVRWYKGRCAFEMRKIHADFAWQSRFHDHIIRNAESFERIQTYIVNNPSNWNKDKFNNGHHG